MVEVKSTHHSLRKTIAKLLVPGGIRGNEMHKNEKYNAWNR